jgi:hypothetical protein
MNEDGIYDYKLTYDTGATVWIGNPTAVQPNAHLAKIVELEKQVTRLTKLVEEMMVDKELECS